MPEEQITSTRIVLHNVHGNCVYLGQNIRNFPSNAYRTWQPDEMVAYDPFCDDFGPMNISSVISFIEQLEAQIALYPTSKIVFLAEPGKRALTNAVFLLGAYLILKVKRTSQQVAQIFKSLNEDYLVPFRDATFSEPDFGLTLTDCWRGLERGVANGWLNIQKCSNGMHGMIDMEEYDQYDDPLNADLHEVIPQKMIAFKGPRDLDGGVDYFDDEHGYRHFSPSFYAKIFQSMGVTDVVRLNEPQYDRATFEAHGMTFHDLEFEDCTAPPPHIIQAFLRVVDAAKGTVAVHCRAGLGRTGTLIALHMMRSLNFSAREAMGWLRVMRPGCVIGEQQQFLVQVELCVARSVANSLRVASCPAAAAAATPPVAPSPAIAPNSCGRVSIAALPRATAATTADPDAAHNLKRIGSLPLTRPAAAGPASVPSAAAAAPAAAAADVTCNSVARKRLAAAVLAEQVARGMERRGAARSSAARISVRSCKIVTGGGGASAAATPAAAARNVSVGGEGMCFASKLPALISAGGGRG